MIRIEKILNYINEMKDIKVLVIGETIIDEYQYGYTLGKAGKFPIVAFQNEKLETYNGGVQAIKNHLKDFCHVDMRTGWKQFVKKRYIQNGQKLFETYSIKEDLGYDESLPLKNYDLVIVADFGHGFLSRDLIDEIESEANYICLNTQLNAGNMGMNTINKYQYADYICIDQNELRLATSDQYGDLEKIVKRRFSSEQVASITLSKKGSLIYKNGIITYSPALAENIVDTIGAGDAYLSITSLLAYLDAPAEVIGYLGNIAGAIACEYQGNKESITKERLMEYVN